MHDNRSIPVKRILRYALYHFTVPGHEAALRHIASLKNELSELRAQLVMKVEDMAKSETQLQSEVC